MCGIAGFFHPKGIYQNNSLRFKERLSAMGAAVKRRGPDDEGIWLGNFMGLSHRRLSIIDPEGGRQPMANAYKDGFCAIAYNGELYNTKEIKKDLLSRGCRFKTSSDTEVILVGYMEYGTDFVKRLNGIFAIAIADTSCQTLFLFRDRVGVKPLFYTVTHEGEVIFGSELKALFALPEISPRLDITGANEIFSLGPARTDCCGVLKDIREVRPGHFLTVNSSGLCEETYWKLESRPHTDSWEQTVEKTAFLVTDSIRRQMVSDVPICAFLSGGLDSSLVSAVCAAELRKNGRKLTTFSFDFTGNDLYFRSNDFQPTRDRPYAEEMADYLKTDHHFLECDSLTLEKRLSDSVLAHDLPAMGDIDSSLLQFCSMVKDHCKVALTGECADEIFGGYPWFHKESCLRANTFPWTMDLAPRRLLLKDDFLAVLHMDEYVKNAYEHSLARTPRCPEDTPLEARRREISWLNLNWFMRTLLERMDRTSMYCGLEARVPFADHRIIEYLWNVPWEMKAKDGVAKGLLRHAAKGLLPEEVLWRKKSPYPKTYDKKYEVLLAGQIRELIHDPSAPVMEFLDQKKVETFLKSPSDYGKPWYGQLMAGPQMMAYILQVNFWLSHYGIKTLIS